MNDLHRYLYNGPPNMAILFLGCHTYNLIVDKTHTTSVWFYSKYTMGYVISGAYKLLKEGKKHVTYTA